MDDVHGVGTVCLGLVRDRYARRMKGAAFRERCMGAKRNALLRAARLLLVTATLLHPPSGCRRRIAS